MRICPSLTASHPVSSVEPGVTACRSHRCTGSGSPITRPGSNTRNVSVEPGDVEFYVVKVPPGREGTPALTPRIFSKEEGDRLSQPALASPRMASP